MNPKGRQLVSIEDYGYGKGVIIAEEEFRKLISLLDILQHRRRMNVVFLVHSKVVTFKNPAGPDYDRWEPKTHTRISRVLIEWAENVLFGYFEINASKTPEDKERHKMSPDKARAKGFGGAVRLIGTQKNALYDAKNRVNLPAEMTLEDPRELVPLLLGHHIKPIDDGGRVLPMRPAHERPAPPPRDERDQSDNGRNMSREAPREQAPDRRGPPPGVPAHHESRLEDEKRRADEAFAKARGEREPFVDPEPTREVSPEKLLKAAVEDAEKRAGQHDQTYGQRVKGWVVKADGDPKKLNAIIADVNKTITNSQPRQ